MVNCFVFNTLSINEYSFAFKFHIFLMRLQPSSFIFELKKVVWRISGRIPGTYSGRILPRQNYTLKAKAEAKLVVMALR